MLQRIRFLYHNPQDDHKITTSLRCGYVKQKGWQPVLAIQMQDEFQENLSSAIKLAACRTQINNELALKLNCTILKVFAV